MGELNQTLRRLMRAPGFAVTAVAMLAFGVGAATSIYSVVDTVLFRPLPYALPERLTALWQTSPAAGMTADVVAPGNFHDWRERSRSFEAMSAAVYWETALTAPEGAKPLRGLRVSANTFELFGVKPVLGQGFHSFDDNYGGPKVAILSYGLWQRQFGGDRSILGRSIPLNHQQYTVVGVMPEDFRFPPLWPLPTELWSPLQLEPRDAQSRRFQALRIFGRLQEGVSPEQAGSEMRDIALQIEREHPETNRGVSVIVQPLHERMTERVRTLLLLLLATAGGLLAVVCANLSNLMLIRLAERSRELTVRSALGASRWALVRHALLESGWLGLMAGGIGCLLAVWLIDALPHMLPGPILTEVPRLHELEVDWRVAAVAAVLALTVSLLGGLAPFLRLRHASPQEALRQGGRTAIGSQSSAKLHRLLIGGQVAMALVLLTGATLLLRSFVQMLRSDPGLRAQNLLTFSVALTEGRGVESAAKGRIYMDLLDALRQTPGVDAAGAINHIPLAGDEWGTPFRVPGKTPEERSEWPRAVWRVVSPGYAGTAGLRLVAGRFLSDFDRDETARVVMINETMARRYWGGDAVGRPIYLIGREDPVTVAGVIADVKQSRWTDAAQPELYFPMRQLPDWRFVNSFSFVIRGPGDPNALAGSLRQTVRETNPTLAMHDVRAMTDIFADSVARQRVSLMLLASLAALAVAMVLIGLFTVVRRMVLERTPEMGLRLALGAAPRQIGMLVIRQWLTPVAAGCAIGLAASLGLTRLMESLLYEIRPWDPVSLAAATMVVLTATFLACRFPARRASRIEPLVALRYE